MSKEYVPEGSLCDSCAYRLRTCDHLDFSLMKPIRIDKEEAIYYVECTEYIRRIT